MSDSETLMNDLSTCMYRKFRKTLDFSPFLHWRITAIFTEKILIENNSGPDNSSSTNLCSQNVRETRAAIRHSSASAKMSKQSPPFVLPRRESILLRKIPNTRQLITNSIWGGACVFTQPLRRRYHLRRICGAGKAHRESLRKKVHRREKLRIL